MTSPKGQPPGGPPQVLSKAGDSAVQVAAEREIISLVGVELGVELRPTTIRLVDGVSIAVDGVDEARAFFAEAYARQGFLKGAQKKKIAQDILKLSLVRANYPGARLILAFASQEACRSLRGWVAHAAQVHDIELLVVDIPAETRLAILRAQERQYR